jgi:hypothetical protein
MGSLLDEISLKAGKSSFECRDCPTFEGHFGMRASTDGVCTKLLTGEAAYFLHAGTYFASIRCHRGSNPGSSFMQKENGQVIETAVEARAGFLDRPTLVVLIVSTCLTIGLAAIYLGFVAH